MIDPGPEGLVRVGKAGVDDGLFHRFGVMIDGTVVRFFAMRSGSKVVPAFDACLVCGAYGYVFAHGRLVCLACAADINSSTIGVGGGCNPVPLPYQDGGKEIVIAVKDLKAELEPFRAAAKDSMAPPKR